MTRLVDVGDPTSTCPCGSRKFVIEEMHLTLHDVPLVYGDPYPWNCECWWDDALAESGGWNRMEDRRVHCIKCSKKFRPDTETNMLVEQEESEVPGQ